MKTTFQTYKVQYQEVDGNRRLRLYTLENLLLNAAGNNADECGFGIKYMLDQDLTWVVTNMSVEVKYLPTHGEKICIETWVENAAHMLSTRNFRLWLVGNDGELQCEIGRARSVWAVISLEDRSIQNVFDQEVFVKHEYGEKIEIGRTPRFLNIEVPDGYWTHKIVYSDIDYNGHCNSCKYLEFMLNAFEPAAEKAALPQKRADIVADGPTLRMDLRYAKELHRGEEAVVRFKRMEDGAIQYEVRTHDGELACVGRVGLI